MVDSTRSTSKNETTKLKNIKKIAMVDEVIRECLWQWKVKKGAKTTTVGGKISEWDVPLTDSWTGWHEQILMMACKGSTEKKKKNHRSTDYMAAHEQALNISAIEARIYQTI